MKCAPASWLALWIQEDFIYWKGIEWRKTLGCLILGIYPCTSMQIQTSPSFINTQPTHTVSIVYIFHFEMFRNIVLIKAFKLKSYVKCQHLSTFLTITRKSEAHICTNSPYSRSYFRTTFCCSYRCKSLGECFYRYSTSGDRIFCQVFFSKLLRLNWLDIIWHSFSNLFKLQILY